MTEKSESKIIHEFLNTQHYAKKQGFKVVIIVKPLFSDNHTGDYCITLQEKGKQVGGYFNTLSEVNCFLNGMNYEKD